VNKYVIAAALAASLIVPAAAMADSAPNVRCMSLDRAEHKLRARHLHVVERGGGFFGIVVKANWVVVNQRQHGNTVIVTAGRSC
jgi:hypothetical protein